MSLPVAILAGGLATRLGPITQAIPKSLVDIAGKPFIVRQMEYLCGQGIDRVVLCLGHLGEQIEAVVGDGSAFGLNVRYSWDGPNLLGTGGALKQAVPLIGDSFFVFYGDSYLPIGFRSVESAFAMSGKPALMTVLKNDNRWDKSNVIFQDGKLVEYNKKTRKAQMEYIDYGLTVLSANVMERVPSHRSCDLAELYHELSIEGLLAGHEVFERFYEIGSPQGLEETIAYFEEGVKS